MDSAGYSKLAQGKRTCAGGDGARRVVRSRVVGERGMSAAMDLSTDYGRSTEGTLPFSCSTNASNDVLEHVRRVKLGSAALEFCLYMHRRTFGDAGFHRKKGRHETSCIFDLARWSADIPADRSNVRRIRAGLEACHIITFAEDTQTPGRGLIAWNMAYEEWQPYDKRRLKKQPGMVISA